MTSIRNILKNFILVLTALIIGLGIAEFFIRGFIPIRNVGPSFTEYDPVYGKALKKNFTTQRITPEFTMNISTNSYGFRGPEIGDNYSPAILFLGDSFTMGYGVNDGEEYPALIRRALNSDNSNDIVVINAGIGGNGNGRPLKLLRNEGENLKPSIVVLQIHENDFRDNFRERLFEISSSGELTELPVAEPGNKRIIQSIVETVPRLEELYLVGLLRQITWPVKTSGPNNPAAKKKLFTYEEQLMFLLLEEIISICKENGWQLLPVLVNISDMRLPKLEKLFTDNGLLTVTIPGKRDIPDLYYNVDGHWNASGHHFAADHILKSLKSNYFNHAEVIE